MSEQNQSSSNSEDHSTRNEAKFVVQRLYVKDSSFESPRSPTCFRDPWRPKVNMDLNSRYSKIETNLYEVVLQITLTTKNDQDETIYLIELQQAGIFMITGISDETLDRTLGIVCPNILFPYAREAIDTSIIKGNFPPLMLAPVNFEVVYEQVRQHRNEKGQIS